LELRAAVQELHEAAQQHGRAPRRIEKLFSGRMPATHGCIEKLRRFRRNLARVAPIWFRGDEEDIEQNDGRYRVRRPEHVERYARIRRTALGTIGRSEFKYLRMDAASLLRRYQTVKEALERVIQTNQLKMARSRGALEDMRVILDRHLKRMQNLAIGPPVDNNE
jgi:hypothetical protein